MAKRLTKVKTRWQPLQEDAVTMQTLIIPELDDYSIRYEELNKDELKNLIKYVEQSNKALEVENILIEKYLNRMDPTALTNMNQILEAAAVAMQKAERTAHLGPGTSSMSIKGVDDASLSSRAITIKSGSSPASKFGAVFGFPGARVPAAQKIEIADRELDELKNALESIRKRERNFSYILRCRNQEFSGRLQEITEAQHYFEQKLLVEGVDPLTGKLPGEKFLRYLMTRLKAEEMEIDKLRAKSGTLKNHLKKVKIQLAQKEELGEILHAVDFEQLQIENRECQDVLDMKIAHVNDVKRVNGKFGNLLNVHRKKLNEQLNILTELKQGVTVKEKFIEKFVTDEAKVNLEVQAVSKAIKKIKWLMKSYTVPEVIEYIKKKADLHDLKKEIKICERQIKLRDLALSSQVHKMRSMNEAALKSQSQANFEGSTRESRVFF